MALCLLNAYWGFVEFMLASAGNPDTALFWVEWMPINFFAVSVLLHFVIIFIKKGRLLKKWWLLAAMYGPPTLFALSHWLSAGFLIEGVIKTRWGCDYIIASGIGPLNLMLAWFPFMGTISFVLALIYYFQLKPEREKKQALFVALGCAVPTYMSWVLWGLAEIIPSGIPEMTPLVIAIQEVLIGYAVWQYDLFGISPVTASSNIIATMSDALILLNPSGNIVSVNRAALDMLKYSQQDLVDSPGNLVMVEETFDHIFTDSERTGETGKEEQKISFMEGLLKIKSGGTIPASISVSTLRNRDGSIAGHVVIARDISDQKRIEEEREQLIRELQDALGNVKTLRGLIPICSACKKIRNDEGYWQQVDEYVTERTDAGFSHSICEDCAEKLYPGLLTRKQKPF